MQLLTIQVCKYGEVLAEDAVQALEILTEPAAEYFQLSTYPYIQCLVLNVVKQSNCKH